MKQNNKFLILGLISFITITCLRTSGQTLKQENPIVFAEAMLGQSGGKAGGLSSAVELNYQIHRSLFTLRYLATMKLSSATVMLTPITPFPLIREKSDLKEFAALYGWRFIKEGKGFSFSLGVSYNSFTENVVDANDQKSKVTTTYIGLPYEVNIKWFKAEKKRMRIYGIIPVGKPTAFGGSIGFKIFGNISRNSYGGLGLTYGLGFHKKYRT